MQPRLSNWRCVERLALWCGLAIVLAADARADEWLQDGREPPLHPSVIVTDYKGRDYAVTHVSKEGGVILVDGKRVKLSLYQSYRVMRAGGYRPGRVEITKENASSNIRTLEWKVRQSYGGDSGPIPGRVLSARGTYEATVVASGDLPDCFIAVVFYRLKPDGTPDPHSTAIAFGEIGSMAAGRPTGVRIDCSYIAPSGTRYYLFPLVFSEGIEVRTNMVEHAARYFRLSEMLAHGEILSRYRKQHPDSDHPAALYLRIPPLLPDGVDPMALPSTINASFLVTGTGEVDSLRIDATLAPSVEASIRRAINGWLFLPRLRQGEPLPTMMRLPLSFAQDSRR